MGPKLKESKRILSQNNLKIIKYSTTISAKENKGRGFRDDSVSKANTAKSFCC